MSLNRTLVAGAGAIIAGVSSVAPKVLDRWSSECQEAIKNRMPEAMIKHNCGPDFGSIDLLLIILIGGGTLLVIQFGKDILQFGAEIYNKATKE